MQGRSTIYAGASPLAGDTPPAGAGEATMARKQTCGPTGDRLDDDGERPGAAIAAGDDGGAMLEFGQAWQPAPASPSDATTSSFSAPLSLSGSSSAAGW